MKELRCFLTIALGSAAEVENHLLLAGEVGIISDGGARAHLDEVAPFRRMLIGLRTSVLS